MSDTGKGDSSVNEAGTLEPEYQIQESHVYDIINCVPAAEAEDPSKTGPRPRRLRAAEVWGYEVGRGLRRRIVTPDDVYKLSQIGMNDREIARWFDIDENTLKYNFSSIIEKGREELKMSLRRAQLKLALSGNAVMLIWLGKNILGQQETPQAVNDTEPLPWQDE